MEALKLQRNISYGSILPIIVFISGLLVIYFFSSQLFAEGMITMLFSSIFYIIMVVIRSSDVNPPTQFNLILENISTFMTFGISSIMFGVMFYAPNVDILFILFIYFFAIANILSVARNWEYDIREALGMPIAFNGIFFPLFFYMYRFYFNDLGDSIFLIYYVITGILTISSFKFLWFDEKYIKDKDKYKNYYSKLQNEDKLIEQRIKDRQNKEFETKNNKQSTSQNTTENNSKIKVERVKVIRKEILEDSILDKIKNSINKIINKQDNFNTISGMPDRKELDETLPHTVEHTKPKKRERLFTKLVKVVFHKFSKNDENWNTIKGMPTEKELEETLPHRQENQKAKKDVINKLSNTSNKPKRKEKVLTKIIKFFQGKKDVPVVIDNYNKISGMPDEKELEETLTESKNSSNRLGISDSLTLSHTQEQTKPENENFDLVGGNNSINSINQIKKEDIKKPISQKEVEEVFTQKQNLEKKITNNSIDNKTKLNKQEPQEEEYNADYDFDQEIDFEENPKQTENLTQEVENINNIEQDNNDNEDFDLGEFENDYQERK
jgi:hypothetical protein